MKIRPGCSEHINSSHQKFFKSFALIKKSVSKMVTDYFDFLAIWDFLLKPSVTCQRQSDDLTERTNCRRVDTRAA